MILRPVRTSQPQGPARIDWSNPITRGLVAATIGGNVVQGNAVSHQSPRLFREGTAFDCTGSEFIDFGSVFNNTNPASLVALFNPDAIAPAIGQEADILSCGDRLTLRINSTGGVAGQILFYLFDGNNWYGVHSGVQVVPGNTCFAAGVHSGNKNAVFLKQAGVFSTASASSPQRAATTQPLRVGLSAETARSLNGGVLFTAAFNRALSDAEIKSLSDNPWQIFAPDSKALWTPAAASVTLPTLVQPNATTSAGAWTATGAGSLHAAINELVPSDTQYISVNSASTTELVLAEAAHPGAANQTLAYRASSTQGSTLTVTLKQGVTTIMTRTHALTGTDTLYTQTLTSGEIALITAGQISVTLTTS